MGVSFEVDRFEWAADDRLELEGRWFGLRGRRFIRPTLDVEVDGEPRRLLALMEHKPWQALDGEDWIAAFAWEGERGDVAAGLAVGPDLTIELPKPKGGRKGKASPKRDSRALPSSAGDGGLKRKLADAGSALTKSAGEVDAMRRALEQKERTVRDLREQLDAAQSERAKAAAEAESLSAEIEELRGRFDAAEAEFAKAVAEREQLREKLEASIAAAQAATEHAKQATTELYTAKGTLAAAEREAEAANGAARAAVAERDELRATTREARHERDAALRARDEAVARLETVTRERDAAQRARDADRAARPQVTGVAELPRRRGPSALLRRSADRTHEEAMALRFAALATLGVVCLLVLVWIVAV
jgi:hypothetical protein